MSLFGGTNKRRRKSEWCEGFDFRRFMIVCIVLFVLGAILAFLEDNVLLFLFSVEIALMIYYFVQFVLRKGIELLIIAIIVNDAMVATLTLLIVGV